jgi:DNA helicase IV
LDEAQDLLVDDYLDIMDMILKGGITRGKWSMFGDFTRQAIYTKLENPDEMRNLLERRTSFIKFKLKVNCRNTKPIGEEIKYITGFDSSEYLWTKIDGVPVNYITYSTAEEACDKLENLLKKLTDEGIDPQKITLLSPVKRESSAVSLIKKVPISDYRPDIQDSVLFSTIQAYKGLENTVIVLADISSFQYEKLMYVGLSRARSALYIFETVEAEKERKKLLMRWIQ